MAGNDLRDLRRRTLGRATLTGSAMTTLDPANLSTPGFLNPLSFVNIALAGII